MKKIIALYKAKILLIIGIFFSINVYAIDDAVNPSGGGSISWEGSLLLRYATAEPSSGYRFVKWEITDQQTGKLKLSSTDNPIHVHRDYVNCHLPSGQDDQCYLITAYFEVISYTITFKNWDGSTITTTNVTQGAMPSYSGSTPTRPSTAQYTYTFSGWTPTIVAATANATYTATYTSTPRYTITFNANGGLIPTNGNMGNTPAGQITTLNDSQTKGSVVVTELKNYFRTMTNDCPSRNNYTFLGWYTEVTDGVPVYNNVGSYVEGTYWDADGKWIGTSDLQLYAHWEMIDSLTIHSGAISGIFSISDSTKVYFSQGNLQYQASSHTWRFAIYQYDIIGSDNTNISPSYSGWIDLFGYGTSGWNSGAVQYAPTSTSLTKSEYLNENLTGAFANADWGVYNAISNGGNIANMWRTMTYNEWSYLLSFRTNASNLISVGTVNSQAGLIILPDNWILPDDVSFTPAGNSYDVNSYNAIQWYKMEKAGAVFLPAAGFRRQTAYADTYIDEGVGKRGCYHTINYNISADRTYFLNFYSNTRALGPGNSVAAGISVRLVMDIPQYTITTNASNGTISGGGTYYEGSEAELNVTPNECYLFKRWSDGNTDNPRTVTVTSDATYTAEFEQIQYTIVTQPANPTQGSATVTNP